MSSFSAERHARVAFLQEIPPRRNLSSSCSSLAAWPSYERGTVGVRMRFCRVRDQSKADAGTCSFHDALIAIDAKSMDVRASFGGGNARATGAAEAARPSLVELSAHPIFDGVEKAIKARLIASSTLRQYRSGDLIVRQGDLLGGLHIVHRGLVDLAHVRGDHECGVLLLAARDLLLPATALFPERSIVSARALTTTKIVVLNSAVINQVMGETRVLADNLLKALAGQWRMAVRNVLDLNCRTSAQRLASFLLRLVDLQPESGAPILPIPKRHVAARLGMTPETLSRMLQVIADNGIYLRGRTIIVRDRGRAEAFCGPDPYPGGDERALNVFAL
jgi:CRP/FNR family transcriptional regulator, transcriptional activator FtrB